MARQQSYLYWSALDSFETCPRKYLWSNGHGNIDLGRGPGRSKAKPPQSRHHAVMGLVLAKAIDHLYNDELWRDPENLVTRMTELVSREFTLTLGENFIDWDEAPSKQDMLRVCMDGAFGFLHTMKANKLLGPYARSEVDLIGWVDQYTPVGGRPDIIIRRDDTGVMILDGKNSMTPGKHTDPDQLRWYALVFYLAYNVMPSRLAFVYFRYPPSTPPKDHPKDQPWTGMVEVSVTRDDLKALGVRAKDTFKGIFKEKFDPTPSAKACQWCDYRTVCDAVHVPTPRKGKSLPVVQGSVEHLIGTSDGFVQFGFDSGVRSATKP